MTSQNTGHDFHIYNPLLFWSISKVEKIINEALEDSNIHIEYSSSVIRFCNVLDSYRNFKDFIYMIDILKLGFHSILDSRIADMVFVYTEDNYKKLKEFSKRYVEDATT